MENVQTSEVKPTAGAKDFFLNLGVFVGLYVSAVSLLRLLFEIINISYPDRLETYVDPYSSAIRWAIAMLVIFFPVYVFLTWTVSKDIVRNPAKKDIWIKRWLSYLTLFVAGVTIAVDLVTLINSFLGGEITTRFVLKVLAVLIVAAVVFGYYIYDLRRAPGDSAGTSKLYATIASVAVLASLIGGFVVMGSPATARALRFDSTRVSDLSNIQWQIVDFWQRTGKLPATTALLGDSISGYVTPTDPETNKPYEYRPTGALTFELCADFRRESSKNMNGQREYYPKSIDGMNDSWVHGPGKQCFDRTIDPTRYPPRSDKSVPTVPLR